MPQTPSFFRQCGLSLYDLLAGQRLSLRSGRRRPDFPLGGPVADSSRGLLPVWLTLCYHRDGSMPKLGGGPMTLTMNALGIDRLSVDDRLALVHEIWDSIAAEPRNTYLSDAQRDELERRVAEHERNPQDVVPWEQVKADALTRFQQ